MIIKSLTLAERARLAQEEKNENLQAALARLSPGERPENVHLPSGLKVRIKRPSLRQMLGGNPLDPEGTSGDDELLKMLKVTRGN
jgi:hypothetical protein